MNPLDVWYNIKMNVKKQIFKGTLYAVVAGCMFGISGIFGQLFSVIIMVARFGLHQHV